MLPCPVFDDKDKICTVTVLWKRQGSRIGNFVKHSSLTVKSYIHMNPDAALSGCALFTNVLVQVLQITTFTLHCDVFATRIARL